MSNQRFLRPRRSRRRALVGSRRLAHEPLEDRRLLAANVIDAPAGTSGVEQTTGLFFNNPGTSDDYTLFSPNTTTTTYLIDKDANVVNQWDFDDVPGLLGYLLDDGSVIRAGSPNGTGGNGSINAAGAGGLIERFDWYGNKIWEYTYDTTTELAHHDFEVLPNGNVLMIAWELKTESAATDAGRDPSLPGAGYLYPDHIIEVEPDLGDGVGGDIVWEWHVWDHLVQEFDAGQDNWYGATGVEDHPELVDLNYVSTADAGGGQAEDWTHANGIDYNAELDQIALSVREFSEFWIIDHSTTTAEAASHSGGDSGLGGDLMYRWGNPQAYDRGDANDRVLYYQHDVEWIPEGLPGAGNLTMFNNGYGRPGTDFTTIEEIAPPVDGSGNYTLAPGQAYGPASTVWTYTAPLENYSSIISSAQRLDNGNTLIDYGAHGTFVEVTAAGVEVWKYVNPYTTAGELGPTDVIPPLGFEDLLINFSFRATNYPAELVEPFLPIPGDGNADGTVDGLDYLIWAGFYGDDPAQDPPGAPANGDYNEDGKVDGLDYLVWASHFGMSNPGAAITSSEPLAPATSSTSTQLAAVDAAFDGGGKLTASQWRISLAFDTAHDGDDGVGQQLVKKNPQRRR